MTTPHPITTALETELERELRDHGIVVWLDRDEHYTPYVDALAERHQHGDFFAPVVAFRGSYLEMLRQLAPYGNGLDPEPLLIHLPGHTEDSVRGTPLLELYLAGRRFRKKLPTLIREAAGGRVRPDELDQLLARGDLSLAAAEAWLQQATQVEPGLAAWLDSLSPEWILDALLTSDNLLAERIDDRPALETLLDHLYRRTGLDDTFRHFFLDCQPGDLSDVRDVLAAWLMCVEYVFDLQRPPHRQELEPLSHLPAALRKTCERLIGHLRDRHPEAYETLADATEAGLGDELAAIRPEDLGKIDTFRGEESRVLKAAIDALAAGEWSKTLEWAQARRPAHQDTRRQATGSRGTSFWLPRDSGRRMAWRLADAAAELGDALERHTGSLTGAGDLDQALERYTARDAASGSRGKPGDGAFEVDRAHRRFEQLRLRLLKSTLPHFRQLHNIADDLRRRYRQWADQLATDFAKLCERQGFLPEPGLQQRSLYQQVVDPLLRDGVRVAYFLIDAFRYEMASELLAALSAVTGDGGTRDLRLSARYAELPTITAVGMNCLAPSARDGELVLAGGKRAPGKIFNGFRSGEFTVHSPKDRVRAMEIKSLEPGMRKSRSFELAEVCERSPQSLKKGCAGATLIVVRSPEIDEAGEANVGLASFETWIRQLKTAWNHLRRAGISDFVFTADHGFELLDRTTQPDQPRRFGNRRDPNRRYAVTTDARREDDLSVVALAALGYQGQEGYLHFRRNTGLFATGNPEARFVHGGNSLQERVIPVLTVRHRGEAPAAPARYRLQVEPLSARSQGFQRLELTVIPEQDAQSILSFTGTERVAVALRVPERDDVQVDLKDATDAELDHQQILLEVGRSAEVAFELWGDSDQRVRLEVYHAEGREQIQPWLSDSFFDVVGTGGGAYARTDAESEAKAEPAVTATITADSVAADSVAADTSWQTNFKDPKILQVFRHIETHGVITEQELQGMLGSGRGVRRFSRHFETYVERVPFAVRIDPQPKGKRYVKGH